MRAWDIYLDGQLIDTVFYIREVEADAVKTALINHDGLPVRIEVRESTKRMEVTE